MAPVPRVLVIDDDVDFTQSVKGFLEANGYEVVEANSGKAGLEKLVEYEPDVIILDIMMETTTEGYGVNQAIKYQPDYAQYRDIPIIMVSSIQEAPDERFPAAGEVEMIRPNRYLTKPLDLDRLLDLLRGAIKR